MMWGRHSLFLGAVILMLVSANSPAVETSKAMKVRTIRRGAEDHDRAVDRAALDAQLLSIKKLKSLLAKATSTQMKSLLTLRLGESYQQAAALGFRIGKGTLLGDVDKFHKEAIHYFSLLIKGYPDFPELDTAYALRGKSYEETKNLVAAKADYLKLVHDYPDHPNTSAAYFSLASFEIDKNNHVEAISYLIPLEKRPFDPFHPFALFRLAWSYYNLKKIPEALGYLERHTAYYRDPKRAADVSSKAIMESGLQDYALFSFDGWEADPDKYPLPYLKEKFLTLGKENAGKMAVRFTKLLRSHAQNQAMRDWKKLVLSAAGNSPTTPGFSIEDQISMLGIIFEHQVNQNRFVEINESCQDLAKVYADLKTPLSAEVQTSTERLVLNAIEHYRTQAIKNKKSTQIGKLSELLISLYDTFIKIIPANDPRTFQSRFNLAEILFEVQDYTRASEQYRFILDHGKSNVIKGFTFADISLRAISSDFEALKKTDIFPKELKAKKQVDQKELPKDFKVWLTHIDRHLKDYKYHSEDFNGFAFEANRVLYNYGQLDLALPRLVDFASRNPKSKFAEPSASLALDTLVLQENWDRVYELTHDWVEDGTWNNTPFMAKLTELSETAFLKRTAKLMAAKNFSDALSQTNFFLKKFPKSQYRPDAWLLKSQCHFELKQDTPELEALTHLIGEHPTFAKTYLAYQMRSNLNEKRLKYGEASQDLMRSIELTPKELADKDKDQESTRVEKSFFYAWLDKKLPEIFAESQTNGRCKKFERLCQKYLLIQEIEKKQNLGLSDQLDGKESPEVSYLFGIRELLINPKQDLDSLTRNLKRIHDHYAKTDKLFQLTFLPELATAVQASFPAFQDWVKAKYPIMDDSGRFILSIKKLVRRYQEFEDAVAPIVELPWVHVRVSVLYRLSEAYRTLSEQLRNEPLPRHLSLPDQEEFQSSVDAVSGALDEKRLAIQEKAFQLASDQSVELSLYKEVSESFYRDHPKQSATIRFAVQDIKPIALKPELLLPDYDWEQSDAIKLLKQSYDQGNTVKMVYLIDQQKNQPLLWSLIASKLGARSEALNEIEKGLTALELEARTHLQVALLSQYLSTYAVSSAKKHFQTLRKPEVKLNSAEQQLLKKAAFSLEGSGAK